MFLRTLFFSFLFTYALFSRSEPVIKKGEDNLPSSERINVSPLSEPTGFVGDVNVIFGNFSFATVDCAVSGPANLQYVRYYDSSSVEENMFLGLGMSADYPLNIFGVHAPIAERPPADPSIPQDTLKDYAYVLVGIGKGAFIRCATKFHEKDGLTYYIDPETISRGYTNAGSRSISGRTNIKNMSITYTGHGFEYPYTVSWKVRLSDGGERIYYETNDFFSCMNPKKERRPNGTGISFTYFKDGILSGQLRKIIAENGEKNHLLGFITVDQFSIKDTDNVTASNETFTKYDTAVKSFGGKKWILLKGVESNLHSRCEYTYKKIHGLPRMTRISYPKGRFLSIHYDDDGRVISQKAPVGKEGKEATTYRFEYHPKSYYTNVIDATGAISSYHYSARKRLEHVQRSDSSKNLLRGERFFWGVQYDIPLGKKLSTNEGHLLGRLIEDDHGVVWYTAYQYDSAGNILTDTLYGNLTGTSHNHFSVSKAQAVEKDTESYETYAAYSEDHFHLLTKKSEENGPTVEYEYKKNTDLLSAIFTKDGSHIRSREFFSYDSDAQLVTKIIDDGDSCDKDDVKNITQRLITRIKRVSSYPKDGAGLPSEIEELYLDDGHEKRLSKTTYEYTKRGLVEKETHYDAHDHKVYALSFSYDSMGNCTKKHHSGGKTYQYLVFHKKNNLHQHAFANSS